MYFQLLPKHVKDFLPLDEQYWTKRDLGSIYSSPSLVSNVSSLTFLEFALLHQG